MLGAMPGLLWVLGTVSHKPTLKFKGTPNSQNSLEKE